MGATIDRHTWIVVALCAIAYLYVFPYFPKINNPNENVRLYMTAAIVENGTYAIDAQRERWGWVNDAACTEARAGAPLAPCVSPRPAPGTERHYYSVKAPGTSLLGVPGYALYRWLAGDDFDRTAALWTARFTATTLPTLIFLLFFYPWLRRQSPWLEANARGLLDAVFFSAVLGSLLLGYTYMFASHTPSAIAAFGGFMILYDIRHGRRASGVAVGLAGALVAAATFFEYPCFLVSLALSVYALIALRRPSRCLVFCLGALIPTAMVMHFQWHAFGSPWSPGHLFVENAAFRAGHEEGFFGARVFHPEAAWRLLFDFRLGLFTLTPILLFAAPGFIRLLKDGTRRFDAAVILTLTGVMYVFICFMNIWHAGWSIGPRYLAVLVPFLAWATSAGVEYYAQSYLRTTVALALGCSTAAFIACGWASMYYPHLPGALNRPIAQLFALLVAHDFAPYNAANFLNVYGSLSMLPMMMLALGILTWLSHSLRVQAGTQFSRRWATWAGALAVPALLVGAQFVEHGDQRSPRKAVAFITRTWSPEGHDAAARLQQQMQASQPPTAAGYERLANLYTQEGRAAEANHARRSIHTRAP